MLAVLAAALVLLAASFPWPTDATALVPEVAPAALSVARGEALFDAAHPLHRPLAWLMARFLPASEPSSPERALLALRLLSAAGGALATAVVFRFAAGLAGPLEGLWLAGVHALAAGSWLYGGLGAPQPVAAGAVAWVLARASSARMRGQPQRALPLALGLALAVLVDREAVLAAPALLVIGGWRAGGPAALAAGALAAGTAALGAGGLALAPEPDAARALALGGMALVFVRPEFAQFALITWLAAVMGLVPLRPLDRTSTRVLCGLGLHALLALTLFALGPGGDAGDFALPVGAIAPTALAAGVLLHPRPRTLSRVVRGFPQVASLVLVASGNLLLLVQRTHAEDLLERSRTALEWAGPAGLVLALDAPQLRALQLVAPDSPAVVDATPGGDADALRGRVDATLAAGGDVLLARDVELAGHVGLGPWSSGARDDLIEGRAAVKMVDDAGRHTLDLLRPTSEGGAPR